MGGGSCGWCFREGDGVTDGGTGAATTVPLTAWGPAGEAAETGGLLVTLEAGIVTGNDSVAVVELGAL